MQVILADWVFGYGSLIWSPEFDFERAEHGRLHGYHRAFCIRSTRYRGTPANPGVVLGLDRGGSCTGVAYQLAQHQRAAAIEKLYEREMRNRVYCPTLVSIILDSGQRIEALTFTANRESDAYQRLDDAEVLRRLTGCCGERGPNVDYLINTHRSLHERGMHDAMLARLVDRLT
jgi:glutathione-specific gamma-glutamylcyclotransferase